MPLSLISMLGSGSVLPAGGVFWHAHELLLGYAAAVIAGFLFTAIPNWTGRLPVRGGPLLALVLIWLAGRVAMLLAAAALIPAWLGAAVDLLFVPVIMAVAAREIIAGKNWRNLRVLGLVALLLLGNIAFHTMDDTWMALRLCVAGIIALIILIGGRVTPSFTTNWLARQQSKVKPASFSRFDAVAIAVNVAALLVFAFLPLDSRLQTYLLAPLSLLAAVLLTIRAARWYGWHTWSEKLLVILHIGYAFIPLGFVLLAGSILLPGVVPYAAALHAWTVGAIGTVTLGVMTRATLGHSGRPLTADRITVGIYICVILAALLRIVATFIPGAYVPLLHSAGTLWTLAMLGFVIGYGPGMFRRRAR